MKHKMINKIIQGDSFEVLKTLPDESVDMIMTSPPYRALRDYGVEGQLGLESDFKDYISKLCTIFDEAKRVLKPNGTCRVNLGDTYGNSTQNKNNVSGNPDFDRPSRENVITPSRKLVGYDKCLLNIPNRFAIEMTDRGGANIKKGNHTTQAKLYATISQR